MIEKRFNYSYLQKSVKDSSSAILSLLMLPFVSLKAQETHVFWRFRGIKVMDLSITVLCSL